MNAPGENEQTDDDENEQMDDDYFPDVLVETLLETPFVKQHLGQSVTVEAVDSDEFAEKIRKYVDSRGEDDDADDEEPQQYWPLIKQVRICVKADVLSSGAVLVDLPGAGDSSEVSIHPGVTILTAPAADDRRRPISDGC